MSELTLTFSANLFPSRPVENSFISIELSNVIALDGTVFSGEFSSFYLTKMEPFYSNAMAVRMIAGQFLENVGDDVLDQFIWHFSREADFKNYSPCASMINPERYRSYRMRWVTAATVITLLSGTTVNSRMQKRLGDISVLRDGAAKELLNNMRGELEELSNILEDGGNWGRHMEVAVKAQYHPDTPIFGRMWADRDSYPSDGAPGANNWSRFSRDDRPESRKKKNFRTRQGF